MRAFKSFWAWVRPHVTTTSSIWGRFATLALITTSCKKKKNWKEGDLGHLHAHDQCQLVSVCVSFVFTYQGEHSHISLVLDAWLMHHFRNSSHKASPLSAAIIKVSYSANLGLSPGSGLTDCAKRRFMNFGNEAFQGFKRRWENAPVAKANWFILESVLDLILHAFFWCF